MRRAAPLVLATAVLVAVVALGLSQTGTSNEKPKSAAPSATEVNRLLANAPAPLAALHAQANDLLPGSKQNVRARLAALRGRPVVVNKWASWCGPCRAEFPFFQRVGAQYGTRVAFVGLNSGDNDGDARAFLRKFPVTYPSYTDGNERIAVSLGAGTAYPITIFYDAQGQRQYIHQGGYASEAKLLEDLRRYALKRA
jgi:thiol-disulfide isomerase/thioredoxin